MWAFRNVMPGFGRPPDGDPPDEINYDAWLGSTPDVYYTEIRVHPQDGTFSRPGWLRCEQFGAGMITGWGAHHVDIAHVVARAIRILSTRGAWNRDSR